MLILSAVVLFLCIVKTCMVNDSLGGNDERRVRVTNSSDSLTEVVLLSNRTPSKEITSDSYICTNIIYVMDY